MAVAQKPFHESIVDTIDNAELHQMPLLAQIIKTTKIPKGHDTIIEAWQRCFRGTGINDDLGVSASVLEQKQVEEKKAAEKAATSADQPKKGG